MRFTELNIDELVNRLGWSEIDNNFTVEKIGDENKVSTSGRNLQSFHELVRLKNVHKCMPKDTILKQVLLELRQNVAKEILNDLFINDSRSEEKDYSAVISSGVDSGIFDDALGYCHAVKVLQMILSNDRSNLEETIGKANASKIHQMLLGYRSADGRLLADGLTQKCQAARDNIRGKIYGYCTPTVFDITNCW